MEEVDESRHSDRRQIQCLLTPLSSPASVSSLSATASPVRSKRHSVPKEPNIVLRLLGARTRLVLSFPVGVTGRRPEDETKKSPMVSVTKDDLPTSYKCESQSV